MNITKLILTSNQAIANTIVERLGMKQIEKTEHFTIYEVIRTDEDGGGEQIILSFSSTQIDSISEVTKYVFETYQVFKVLHIGLVGISGNVDIHSGDIVLPNTFITPKSQKPFFLDFAVGENYDFKNFGLILSGICMSGEPLEDHDSDDYGADIYDEESFYILENMKDNEALDKIVVIKGVFDEAGEIKKETVIDNSLAILDFIL